jgi:hypothetical protein
MPWDADLIIEAFAEVDAITSYNCECGGETAPRRTLAQLRNAMLIRLGFAAQAENPPPGIIPLVDEFLRDAQLQIDIGFRERGIERFFQWPLEAGVRYYGLRANADACDVKLSRSKLSWVGIREANGTWYPLIHGIPPTFYSRTEQTTGWPTRYEIRECIEIFPAPRSADQYLVVKGMHEIQPLEEPDDLTTHDSQAVFLLALANAKSHYGHQDAANIFAQADRYLGNMYAASHQTARYIPSPRYAREARVRPIMTEFDV